MKVYPVRAIIERDMRKFFRSPALMMTSMVFPLMQLIASGYAFGGKIKNVNLALVDEDHGAESRVVRQRLNAIVEGPQTFRITEYSNLPDAMTDLRAGFVKAILDIPQDFSQRVLRNEATARLHRRQHRQLHRERNPGAGPGDSDQPEWAGNAAFAVWPVAGIQHDLDG